MNDKVAALVELTCTPEGVTLKIKAPPDGDEDLTYQELMGHLEALALPSLDYAAVKRCYKQERYEPALICPKAVEPFKVEVTSDEMAANVIFYSLDSATPEALKAEVMKALEAKAVTFGLMPYRLEEALVRGARFEKVCVAKGRKPTEGAGQVVHHPMVPAALAVPEGRGVEAMKVWSEPHVAIVGPGAVIAERRKEGPEGEEGMTVTGQPIATLDTDSLTLCGENAEVSDDGDTLTASLKGQLVLHPEGADIVPVKEIEGNLRGTASSVKFEGSVVVRGSLSAGVSIRAGRDVEVWGEVNGATIIADRNIVLRSAINGMNDTIIRAGGRIAAVSIKDAEVAARDSIFVLESLIDCRLGARRRIMMGPEGKLSGGAVVAGELLHVAQLGRLEGSSVQVKVATPDLIQKWHEIWREELHRETEPLRRKKEKLEESIGALIRRKERRGGVLTPHNEQLLCKMEHDLDGLSESWKEIELRMKKLPTREQFARAGKISGLKRLHTGVVLILGTTNFVPRNEDEAQQLLEGPDGITVEWIESCLAAF